MMRGPGLTLRRLLLLIITGSVLYVAAIALVITTRVSPVAARLQKHSTHMLSAHDDIRTRLDVLDSTIGSVHRLIVDARDSARLVTDGELRRAELPIRARLDSVAALRFASSLTDVPAGMREDLANAAVAEGNLGIGLLNSLAELRLGRTDDALATLRKADEYRAQTDHLLQSAERVALSDMVDRERRLGSAATASGRAIIWWLAIGAAMLPLLILFVRDRVHRPLRALEDALTRIARGDLRVTLTPKRDDELGRLSRHVNEMARVLMLRADDERRRRENLSERLGHLLEESDNQILVLAADSLHVLQASRGALEELGYSMAELQNLSSVDLCIASDAGALVRAMDALRAQRQRHVHLEARLVRKDGRSYPVAMNMQLSLAEDPPVFVVVAQDISERCEAERLRDALKDFSLARGSLLAIGDAERSLREIAAATARVLGADRVGIWRVDGALLRCYSHFDRATSAHSLRPDVPATGCPKYVQALRTERVIAVDDLRTADSECLRCPSLEGTGVTATLDASVRTGNLLKGTLRIERGGQARPWSAEEQSFAASMADFAAIAFEGAERRSLQIQLAESQRMESVGQLAGGVAHDFNNLLTAIMSHTELAAFELPEDHPATQDLKGIADAAARAAELTRRLLTFARRQVVDPKVIDLNDLTRRMNKLLRRLIGEDVELVTILDPDLGAACVDPTQFEQVIVNLAVNARDAMPNGGKLTIHTANALLDAEFCREHSDVVPGRYVTVGVTDTGMGMDDAVRARIFEPFFTTKDKSRGTGLGLATVYGIVRQAGGHIMVQSQPGHGAAFQVFLPVASSGALPQATHAEQLPVGGSETILLVEDEAQIRAVLVRGLESRGYHILVAGNGAEALELSRRTEDPIHLLLTDVVMPLMNGPDLARALVDERPETAVIFMSGYTDQAMGTGGVVEPGITFVAKPFTVAELAAKVRATLDAVCLLSA